MKNLARNISKVPIKCFVLGAVLALGAPYLGAMIGLAPTAVAASGELGRIGNPMLVGLVFAAIGTLDALLKPLFNRIFKSSPIAEKLSE